MSTPDVVIASTSFSVGDRAVTEGETFHANHPLVKGREELFKPFVVDNSTVEQATAVPGEKRMTTPKAEEKSSQPAAKK